MVKAEWGTKRACPKCNTRFYDLGKDDPVTCINCGNAWTPEPVLKSKQTHPFEAAKAATPVAAEDGDALVDPDLDIEGDDEEAPRPDDDAEDLGGDEDLGVPGVADEDEV